MDKSRPNIPEPMKREIRQRCGFGCVICGNPLYEYHHMKEWNLTHQHKANEIALLCNMHHAEASKSLLAKEFIEEANENPFNLRRGISQPYRLHFYGNDGRIVLGDYVFKVTFRNDQLFSALLVDEITLIGFRQENEHILIQLNLFDEHNHLMLFIHNSELCYSADNWDVQFEQNHLVVRRESRVIVLDVLFEIPNTIIIKRGKFYTNGIPIIISPSAVQIGGNYFSGGTIINCQVGFRYRSK